MQISKLGLSIISCLGISVLALNIFFWWRWAVNAEIWSNFTDGSCELLSKDYTAGWKTGWTFPLSGPSWTDVPCTVQLKASNGQVEASGETSLHFIYWQGVVWEYLKDRCHHLIPELPKTFHCAFDDRGTAYVGHAITLPNFPRLLLMKAAGLSFLTLGPVLLMCFNLARAGARAREAPKAEEVYAVLSDPDGI